MNFSSTSRTPFNLRKLMSLGTDTKAKGKSYLPDAATRFRRSDTGSTTISSEQGMSTTDLEWEFDQIVEGDIQDALHSRLEQSFSAHKNHVQKEIAEAISVRIDRIPVVYSQARDAGKSALAEMKENQKPNMTTVLAVKCFYRHLATLKHLKNGVEELTQMKNQLEAESELFGSRLFERRVKAIGKEKCPPMNMLNKKIISDIQNGVVEQKLQILQQSEPVQTDILFL